MGFQAVSKLKKTGHLIRLLLLDKAKSVDELVSFAGKHQIFDAEAGRLNGQADL